MKVRRPVAETLRPASPEAVEDLLRACRQPTGDGLLDRRVQTISGGQQRRVALARATSSRHRIAERRTPAEPSPAPTGGLTARRIDVAFRGNRVLSGVDLEVSPGSAVGVTGPSGTGKTLLLRVLAGLHRPDGGTLHLDGAALPARARRRAPEERRRIQFVPQNPLGALNPARTIAATLARPLSRLGGISGPDLDDRVAELLHQVGLPADFADRRPAELSGRQRQRVSIARALAAGPDYLLCDEITSALDPDTGHEIMAMLSRLRTDRGTALLVISHQLDLIETYTDRTLLLGPDGLTSCS
ncbi:ABC transporter family protein [Actinocorallia herbida]|uniref:ABC transporter family protein n=2 Tax=Actinocorallia herbida TaxID=58109 RepID=A0A3N1D213_9ACTN|nr:dipeptide/oligopeptide/nickel ABC transporter ATP-binding protein [Actinocorallia herbida]ROO87552.1 ABC transporter family protein [Actinocorallia herbida]